MPPTFPTTIYPSLKDVMDAARVYLNDWSNSGAGQITTDDPTASPQTLPALNSAVRELYRKLRLVGAPALIRDNIQINLPANAVNGANIQTYLSYQGYFDGSVVQPTPTLPADLLFPVKLMEQQTGSGLPFTPMIQPEFGLPSPFDQGFALVYWEWRGGAAYTKGSQGADALWFVGALTPITIRIRYLAALINFAGLTSADYATTFVPIADSTDFLAYRIAEKIAMAIKGVVPSTANLKAEAAAALEDLLNEQVKRQQTIEYSRMPYALGALADYGAAYGAAVNMY